MINGAALARCGERDLDHFAAVLHNLVGEVAALRVRVAELEGRAPGAATTADEVDALLRSVLSRP